MPRPVTGRRPSIRDASSFATTGAGPGIPQRAGAGRPHRRRGDISRHAGRCGRHHRRRQPGRNQHGRSATTRPRPAVSTTEQPSNSTGWAATGSSPCTPRPGRDDRHRSADVGGRRHAAVGARHLLRRRRRRTDRRHHGGHPDHPPPTRPAVKGFRGGPPGGRPGTRPGRGAAAHADRQGRSGQRAHRDRTARLRAEPDARSHRRRVVRSARQRDPGASVRRRRQPRTAHPAGRDPRAIPNWRNANETSCPTTSPTR